MPDDPISTPLSFPDQEQPPDPLNIASAQAPPDLGSAQAAATPVLAGSPGSSEAQGPPRLGMPLLMQMIGAQIHPPMQASAPGQLARPVSRTAEFEGFLENFLSAFGAGIRNQGTGPGSFGRGMGAAMNAPMDQYNQQLAQQQVQAQTAQEQAKTAQTQEQTRLAGQMVTLPNGTTLPMSALSNYFKGTGAAEVNAQSRMSVEQMKAATQQGQVARVLPGIDPQTQQPAMLAYDKQNKLVGVVPGAFNPASLPKVSTSQQWLQTSPGVWDLVSKTSTSRTVVPGSPQAQLGSKVPSIGAAANTPQAQLQNKVPSMGAAAGPAQGGRRIYGGAPAVAFDPVNNESVLTTQGEAAQKGFQQVVPVKQSDIEKYRTSQAQFNDVQANTSRYRSAATDFGNLPVATRLADMARIDSIINKAGAFDLKVSIGEGGEVQLPGLSALLEGLSRETRSASYGSLSPQGKALVDGYYRTMAAVPAYQKALTGIGRSNKEMLELELNNIPNPTLGPGDMLRKLNAFQENIDQGVAGIPRMKGIPTTKEIRAKFEGGGNQQQPNFKIPRPFAGQQ